LWFEWYWKMCCHHNIVIALLYIALGDIHDNHNCVWSCNLKAWFNFIQLFTFPQVDVDIEVESTESFPISEEIRIKAQSLRFITLLTIFIEVVRFCSLYYGSSCFFVTYWNCLTNGETKDNNYFIWCFNLNLPANILLFLLSASFPY